MTPPNQLRQTRPFRQQTTLVSSVGSLIFFSRWLQAPLYPGLIVAPINYVVVFMVELFHLAAVALSFIARMSLSSHVRPLAAAPSSGGYPAPSDAADSATPSDNAVLADRHEQLARELRAR